MNVPDPNADEVKLRERLRETKPSPALPPRFQESVWRRIEAGDKKSAPKGVLWIESLAALLLRPRFALAAVALLILAGSILGTREGTRSARTEAQMRYVASVAPATIY